MALTLAEEENKLEVSNQKLCNAPDLHQADLPQGGRFFCYSFSPFDFFPRCVFGADSRCLVEFY